MIKKATALLLLLLAIYLGFHSLIPNKISTVDTAENKFSTHRALIHLKEISKETHYLGSYQHTKVRDYIFNELEKLGLNPEIQEGYAIDNEGNLAKAKNIVARIKGNSKGKALLLLTHYDSEPHSSYGASDAGSGVVTILEALRAFLSANKSPKNDIIILISDGEELGLTGANIFVNKHPWAKDVGLVLNFEARGSGGPSIMFLETNQGNSKLIKGFAQANLEYPLGNSLFYSIYKILPNDTDLTVFREDGDIDGFNFAFIGDHFDYHTQLDNYNRLDRTSLEHQGSYLMPLLHYFSEANLNTLKSTEDYIYFNVPLFKTIIYPFFWIYPMLIISIILFIALLFHGVKRHVLVTKDIGKGFLAFISCLIIGCFIGYFGWPVLKFFYPNYKEILHGFTYNGYTYIAAFTCMALACCFFIYAKVYKSKNTASLLIAPIFIWILICFGIALKLKGASYFIIPVFFALLGLFVLVRNKKPNIILLALLCFPVLTIIAPYIQLFPVGLGLKMMITNTLFTVLIFGLLISVLGFIKHKKRLGILFSVLALYFLFSAHLQSGFNKEQPKPNSLVYILNADDNVAVWATYDHNLDNWTKPFLGNNPQEASNLNEKLIDSKYGSKFSYINNAPLKLIDEPVIKIINDTIIDDFRQIKLSITSQRHINRIELFADSTNVFQSFKANGIVLKKAQNKPYKNRLLSYFITNNAPLFLEFSTPKSQKTAITILEASYDLLTNNMFSIPKREQHMMPKPFVLNDAIILKKTLKID